MKLAIPEFCVVMLIGTTGSGKSSFARRHFLPTQVLSSDTFRGLVADDELSLDATSDAFDALHHLLELRLKRGRLTVVDATNVQPDSRRPILAIATKWHALKVAVVLDTPEAVCAERNRQRPDRTFGPHVLRNHRRDLERSLRGLRKEGFHRVYVLKPEELEAVELTVEPVWSRRLEERGPFDIVGDVHGCHDELVELVTQLGYREEDGWVHPEGRRLVFLGDLVDRGPRPVEVVRQVMRTVKAGHALAVPGNHDIKLVRALKGQKVSTNHGLAETLRQFEAESEEFRAEVAEFLGGLVSHALLDGGNLCVAHAGLREEMQGRGSAAVREFALYGETTGEIDEYGLPVRYAWASDYRGSALVVFGHTPVPEAEFYNNTIDIDTGCCFGGKLTALRYPERELVSVPARRVYAEPIRPVTPAAPPPAEDVLDLADVVGRRSIETRLGGRTTIREENAIAALEVMSRFAADPRWLIYLPPTMSPCESSKHLDYLEYPTEALEYYRKQGVATVVAEQKHMGSRAIAVVGRDPESAARRFGVETGERGAILTRTGRRFFDDPSIEAELLARLSSAADRCGLYERLLTDWFLLDLELMPWSAKAQGLLREQYAPVGAAAMAHASALTAVAEGLQRRGLDDGGWAARATAKTEAAVRFREAYRRYCWPVGSVADYRLAPFHLLATESGVHVDQSHLWHMETLAELCAADPEILTPTPYRVVDVDSEDECADLCRWWESLVGSGGEGIVVKPVDFVVRGTRGLVQPAVKCRGPEYLRIIYGPEYRSPENLVRLRERSLGAKRSLARAEFALGVEAMERFLRGEGIRRVHECVFGILALESEPVDPRL